MTDFLHRGQLDFIKRTDDGPTSKGWTVFKHGEIYCKIGEIWEKEGAVVFCPGNEYGVRLTRDDFLELAEFMDNGDLTGPDTCHECGEVAVGTVEGTPLCADHGKERLGRVLP
jgi:hypothetical protein